MVEASARRRFGEGREPVRRATGGRGLVPVLDFICISDIRAIVALLLLCLVFFLPGFVNLPPIDREEVRFAQSTKQMVETDDYVDVKFQDEFQFRKPIGIYWLQSLTVEAAGVLGVPRPELRIWIYRIPSLLGAIGAVLLTYWAALPFVSRRGAILAAIMMCSSILLGIEARLAKADAVFLLTSTAAMGAMARVYLSWQRGEEQTERAWVMPLVFWTAVATGVLVKGPLILIIAGLTIISLGVLDRSAGWIWRMKPLYGVAWAFILVMPWFGMVIWKAGGSFFTDLLNFDLLNRLSMGQDIDFTPPGMFFVIFWLTFWPGSTLAGLAAPAIWRARYEPAAQFLLAWVIPSWVVFELVVVKQPHYVLPLYPAIAILVAGVVSQQMLSQIAWMARGVAWWFVVPVVFGIAAVAGSIALLHRPEFLAWPFVAAAAIFGLFAWLMYDDYRAERSLLNAFGASLFLSVAIYGIVLPALKPLFPSVELARVLRNVECRQPLAVSSGYYEPSLVFMTNASTQTTDPSGAADFLAQGACRFAFVDTRQERAFAQRADAIGLRYTARTRFEGYNYARGRAVSIAVFQSEETR